jgi:glutamine amidotransferase
MSALVAIVDYGSCNLDSVARAFQECGARTLVTSSPSDLAGADALVLPGVGVFAQAAHELRRRQLDVALSEQVADGVPYLGICLGMQLVAGVGTEGGRCDGLGWIDGEVAPLVPASPGERLPHIGWNDVEAAPGSALFAGVGPVSDFYFVHSWHLVCHDDRDVAASSPYCGGFTAAVERGNVFGVQFHPEKSHRSGLRLLANFLAA